MEFTWGRVIRIWWAHAWRSWGIAIIPIATWAVYAIFHLATFYRYRLVADVALFIVASVANIVALRIVLRKTFADFRIAVVPREDGS
jgi:hypothetical protein